MLDAGSQDPIVDDLLTNSSSDAPYALGNHEMNHYVRALDYMKHLLVRETSANDTGTIGRVKRIVLDWFEDYWLREVKDTNCTL